MTKRMLLAASTVILFATASRGQPSLDGVTPSWVDRKGVPTWSHKTMPQDVFRFVRIRYRTPHGSNRRWAVDYPDSDLNVSLRLHELTSLRVDPNPTVVRWEDKELLDYPFVYVVEPGGMSETPAALAAMREYCLRGGFIMFDDFWWDHQWAQLRGQLRAAFPDHDIVDIDVSHPIFHAVFDFDEVPQVLTPNDVFNLNRPDYDPPQYRAIYDEHGRMMVLLCHNTDIGDAWEREGVDEGYFREYAEKKAYPMAINILFYAMTH